MVLLSCSLGHPSTSFLATRSQHPSLCRVAKPLLSRVLALCHSRQLWFSPPCPQYFLIITKKLGAHLSRLAKLVLMVHNIKPAIKHSIFQHVKDEEILAISWLAATMLTRPLTNACEICWPIMSGEHGIKSSWYNSEKTWLAIASNTASHVMEIHRHNLLFYFQYITLQSL